MRRYIVKGNSAYDQHGSWLSTKIINQLKATLRY